MMFLITWLIQSFVNGLIFFLIFLFLLYWFYLKELSVNASPNKPQFEDYSFSPIIKKMIDDIQNDDTNKNGNNVLALNMLFQFLFQELKDTKAVRRYIIRKMTLEFKELLNSKTASKLIQRISAKDFSLGSGFPIIHSLKLSSYQMDKAQKTIQDLSILVDLEYKDGFSISVDADLILGRSAYVHIKIVSIVGKARIQFTRHPFTHWSFAFVEEPQIEFAATSHFDGRQIPQLTNLLLNQLRRSVRRKHTLPNYKCRFKPFFDPVYNQSLYKTHLDELIAQVKLDKTGEEENNSVTNNNDTIDVNLSKINDKKLSKKDALASDNNNNLNLISNNLLFKSTNPNLEKFLTQQSLNYDKNTVVNNLQYRKLCNKLGFDLTSFGQLTIKLKACDRLPESLYSINLPQIQQSSQQKQQDPTVAGLPIIDSTTSLVDQASQQQQPIQRTSSNLQQIQLQQQQQIQDNCFIYLTASLDEQSMTALMEKQISKQDFPTFEFELVRTSINQSLGLSFMEIFFINRTEVVVQKIFPNSLASYIKQLKKYDIIYSCNNIQVNSIKNLNKIIQKAGVNSKLKFVIKRPCILLKKPILTSEFTKKIEDSSLSSNNITFNNNNISSIPINNPLTVDTSNTNTLTPNSNLNTPNNQAINSTANTSSNSIVSNTRQKLERLEQKFKLSFGSGNSTSTNNSTASTPVNNLMPSINTLTVDSVSNDSSSINQLSTPITTIKSSSSTSQPTPSQLNTPTLLVNTVPLVTHTASATSLVDYFCTLSECSTLDQLDDLDLISLLTNPNTSTELNGGENDITLTNSDIDNNFDRNKSCYKKTRLIKLDKENLFSFNNCVTQIDEAYTFDLNKKTKYLNIFLWTVQYMNKMTKMKNLLIGYITLPLHECIVDCWNVSKGETQTTIHFRPIEELKASAISRVIKSHVLASHPGFDSNLSVGSLTLNIQHKLAEPNDLSNVNNNIDVDLVELNQNVSNKIADELVEQKVLETELNKKLADGISVNGINNGANGENDDGSIHKFVNVQFNDITICEFCNKKIWLKNAYRCAYCGYVIHIKCYEKTIGKTICGRFFSKLNSDNNSLQPGSSSSDKNNNSEESYVVIADENRPKRSISPSQISCVSSSSDGSISTSRSLVSNLWNGIRQRRKGESHGDVNQNSSKTNSFLNSINLGIINRHKNILTSSKMNENGIEIKRMDNEAAINSKNSSEENDNLSYDDFKDIDQNEDKLYGIDLFEELPNEERKQKFEETIQKYQSTIEMMLKIKKDLEKELYSFSDNKSLISNDSSKSISITNASAENSKKIERKFLNKEEQLKMQIKHLDQQIKGVEFLLMQCQIGLEIFNDTNRNNANNIANNTQTNKTNSNQADSIESIKTSCNDNNNSEDSNHPSSQEIINKIDKIDNSSVSIVPKINVGEIESN